GWYHIFTNMLALLFLGALVEAFYGRVRFLIFYVLCGVAGMTLSYEAQPHLSVGASAAILGLAGVMIAHQFKYRAYLPPAVSARLSILFPLVLVEIVLSWITPGIDLFGHVGGVLCGIFLGAITESRVAGELQGQREWMPVPA